MREKPKYEKPCDEIHRSLEEAIEHAYRNLVQGNKHLLSQPFWGSGSGSIGNVGKVIGWASSDGRKRWRLDYDPEKGVHVNEEDYTFTEPRKVFHKVPISFLWANTYLNKWSSRYDKPPHVLDAEKEIDRLKKEKFK